MKKSHLNHDSVIKQLFLGLRPDDTLLNISWDTFINQVNSKEYHVDIYMDDITVN